MSSKSFLTLLQVLFILKVVTCDITSENNTTNEKVSERSGKDLNLQTLKELNSSAESEAQTKPPPWITVESLKEHPEWLFNATEAQTSDVKILGPLDLFTECLEHWVAPKAIRMGFPYYHAGYDDDGRPVWIVEIGKYDLKKVVETGGQMINDFEKYMRQAAYRVMQSIMDKLSPENRNVEARFLLDFDGLNIAQLLHLPTIKVGLKYSVMYSRIMINHMGPSVIINANYPTELAINIVKPVLPTVVAKVEVYGTNKSKWLPKLRSHFPLEILPEWYGGSKDFKPVNIYG